MRGVEDFQSFIEENCPGAYVPVDLLKITQAIGFKMPKRFAPNPSVPFSSLSGLCLVIDGECCLDRLYGGYFNDWACGGQWNRTLQFLQILLTTMTTHNIKLVVFFNGALEMQRFGEWSQKEIAKRNKVKQILRHVRQKRTPPPKVLWMPPVGLRSCLRLAFRHFMIPVMQSTSDHLQEVLTFLRSRDFDAVIAEGAEYMFFDPPRYFSAEHLKLTFRGSLETRELIVDAVAKKLELPQNRFCLLAAMLGNYILPREELKGFYEELTCDADKINDSKVLVGAIAEFIRNLQSVDDVLSIGKFIFRKEPNDTIRQNKAQKFLRSVQYFMNGTREHYQKFFTVPQGNRSVGKDPQCAKQSTVEEAFASEAKGGELEDVSDGALPKLTVLDENALNEMQEQLKKLTIEEQPEENGTARSMSGDEGDAAPSQNFSEVVDEMKPDTPTSPESSKAEEKEGTPLSVGGKGLSIASPVTSAVTRTEKAPAKPEFEHIVPQVHSEVTRVAGQRHEGGLMHPWVYNVLTHAELKMEVHLEEGDTVDCPHGWMVFRPIRQAVYAVVFNLNHKNYLSRQQRDQSSKSTSNNGAGSVGKQPVNVGSTVSRSVSESRIFVKEWIYWAKRNTYQFPEYVPAVPLEWHGVPTVQRLWFGQNPDDKKKRMRAFLTCMRSDTPLIMNQNVVPQHMLLLCCVLRYMTCYPDRRLLQRHELDAFLAQAVSPQLMDPNRMQEIAMRCLSARGVQLAQLFMQGIEHAIFANDACGSPVPWVVCCPWMFFDGKLFQVKLDLAERKAPMVDLCAGDLEQISRFERLKQAILEGVNFPLAAQHVPWAPQPMGPPLLAQTRGGRGMIGRRDILSRGGQLEIAGVVVGQWGGSPNVDKGKPRMPRAPPQVTTVGAPPLVNGRGPMRAAPPPPLLPPPPPFIAPPLRMPPPVFGLGGGRLRPPGPVPLMAPFQGMAFDYYQPPVYDYGPLGCGLLPLMPPTPPVMCRTPTASMRGRGAGWGSRGTRRQIGGQNSASRMPAPEVMKRTPETTAATETTASQQQVADSTVGAECIAVDDDMTGKSTGIVEQTE